MRAGRQRGRERESARAREEPLVSLRGRENKGRIFADDFWSLQISEAYQVLSNADLRKQYDLHGKAKAVPDSGFGNKRNQNRGRGGEGSF